MMACSVSCGILIVLIIFGICYKNGFFKIKKVRTESHLASCETEQSIVTVKSFPEIPKTPDFSKNTEISNYSPQIPRIKIDAYQYIDPGRLSNGSTSKPLLKNNNNSDGMTEI